jgi:hypothetical protein
MCKVELKVQGQFIAGILIKNGISEISVEDKDKLLKDSYANELLSNGLLKIEDVVEVENKKTSSNNKSNNKRKIVVE